MTTLKALLSAFPKELKTPGFVLCLQADGYPILLCQHIISHLSKIGKQEIVSLPMSGDSTAPLMAALQTEFLGQRSIYWLHADESLSKKNYDLWLDFLRSYSGPHAIIFCATKPLSNTPSNWMTVPLPAEVDISLFKLLASTLDLKNTQFIDQIFQSVRYMPPDTALLLCQYGKLVGRNTASFTTDWLPSLVVPEQSLFNLSQALFGKKAKSFYLQWKQFEGMYPLQFWLTFWSEQIWRAYCYVRLQRAGKILAAKKIGYRLPFSFLNKDWRLHSLQKLADAHRQIYSLDYHIKQGGKEHHLELLYNNFFS